MSTSTEPRRPGDPGDRDHRAGADKPGPPPAGCEARPLTRADSALVHELMAAQELADLGEVEIEEADIVADWQRPSTDLARDSVLVVDTADGAGTAVGYAELTHAERYEVAVRPEARGRGIGTWLAAWVRHRARERGAGIVGVPVPEGSAGDRLLEALGYQVRWTSWQLALPADRHVPERDLPPGHVVRPARPEEHRAVWDTIEDAFLEWSQRERQPYEDFEAQVVRRPGFEPWHLLVAVEETAAGTAETGGAGEVVGVSWSVVSGERTDVARLAVRRDRRGRGLAQALLVAAFAAGREHGAPTATLSTDSRTGALGLYQRVGMEVTATWVHRAVHL